MNTTSKYVRADGTTTVNQTKPQLTNLTVTGGRGPCGRATQADRRLTFHSRDFWVSDV